MVFFGLGAFAPLLFVLVPLALGVLLYAYRRGGSGTQLVVSSVIFLRQLSRPVSAPRKFRPPLRLLFELLLVLLLISAAAGLYFASANARVMLLIDNSLSMGARTVRGVEATTNIAEAVRTADEIIDELPFGAQVEVWATSPALHALTSGFVGVDSARAVFADLKIVYGRDNLSSAIDRLRDRASGSARLIVVSDRRVRTTIDSSHFESRLIASTSPDNIAITNTRLIAEGNTQKLFAEVELFFFADSSRTGKVRIVAQRFEEQTNAFKKVSEEQRAVRGGGRTSVRFPVPDGTRALRIHAEPLEGVSAKGVNALREDDVAYLSVNPIAREGIVVSDLSREELGLARLPNFQFEVMTPNQFEQGMQSNARFTNTLIILHRFVASTLPDAALLIVMPPLQAPHVSAATLAYDAKATSWLEGHPLTSYINFSALVLPQQVVLQTPGWAQEILRTTAGTALYAGERSGNRMIVSGIELLPFEGRESPLNSILFLNMVRWLTTQGTNESGQSPWYTPTFMPFELPRSISPEAELFLVTDRGSEQLVVPDRDSQSAISLEHPGLVVTKDGVESNVRGAINFFEPAESRIDNTEPIEIAQTPAVKQEGGARSLVEWCIYIALALMLLDFLWLVFRPGRLWSQRGRSHAA